MPKQVSLIVGTYFRPPANSLIRNLPPGTELTLVCEPDNPYDSNALRVDLPLDSIPEDPTQVANLNSAMFGTGWSVSDLLATGQPVQIGYCPRQFNKNISILQSEGLSILTNEEMIQHLSSDGPGPWPGTLSFSMSGEPLVKA